MMIDDIKRRVWNIVAGKEDEKPEQEEEQDDKKVVVIERGVATRNQTSEPLGSLLTLARKK